MTSQGAIDAGTACRIRFVTPHLSKHSTSKQQQASLALTTTGSNSRQPHTPGRQQPPLSGRIPHNPKRHRASRQRSHQCRDRKATTQTLPKVKLYMYTHGPSPLADQAAGARPGPASSPLARRGISMAARVVGVVRDAYWGVNLVAYAKALLAPGSARWSVCGDRGERM
jgi:hypothetical protein